MCKRNKFRVYSRALHHDQASTVVAPLQIGLLGGDKH